MKSSLYLAVLLLITQNVAFAHDSGGNYAVWGKGKKSCFGFQKDVAKDNIQNYRDYMKGFLTAYNVFTEKTFNISGNKNETEVLDWLKAYCADNPMASFESALTNFTFDHYDERSKTARSAAGSGW